MRNKTSYYLRRAYAHAANIPFRLYYYWPLGIVALVTCGVYPLAGLGLALWFALLVVHTFLTPAGPSGNGAGAWGDMASILFGVIGAVLSLVAAGIGTVCGALLE